MSEAIQEKRLPACPVEVTLTLISNKWKVLILRDLLPGETLRGIEEVDRYGDAEGSDGAVKGNGSFRLTDAHRVCRGAPAGGIRAD